MADQLYSGLGVRPAILTTDILAFLPLAGPPAQQGDVAKLITLLDTIYVNVTGDTMTGPLLFSADNTHDIGAVGATRPRTGYFGTSVVTVLLASPAATALSFASAGTTRANFSTAGHLLFNVDAASDIGASGANRPRSLFLHGSFIQTAGLFNTNAVIQTSQYLEVGGNQYLIFTGRTELTSPADSILLLRNAAETDFNRIQLGGTTSSFPSLKRSAALLQARLADDSAYCDFEARLLRTTPGFTVATLPAAGTAGRRSYVTDALAPAFGAAVAGTGAVVIPVFDDGAAWIVG